MSLCCRARPAIIVLSILASVLLGWRGVAAHALDSRAAACDAPANPVVAENCKPGTDGWIVRQPSVSIEGYAYPTSVVSGEAIAFFINTNAQQYSLSVYRVGYYGGAGARLIQSVADLAGTPQPACIRQPDTGLTSCGNWSTSYRLEIPNDWISGLYLVKLTRADNHAENYFLFTLRDDARHSDLLFQQSYFTYQAYNRYGGKSTYHYTNNDVCPTVTGEPRAVKVAFRRPSDPEGGDMATGNSGNTFFTAEYAMVYWLESQGYDVTYSTDLDTHRSGKPGAQNQLLKHRAFLIVGHDEYWSQEMRDAVTAARDAKVHIASFSANTSYWRVRLEADPITGEADAVLAVYKTTQSSPPDPSGTPTGTWRDPAGANDPEAALLGVQYVGDNDGLSFPLRVSAEQGKDRIYRYTDLQRMPPDSYADISRHVVGWEWDSVTQSDKAPPGLEILASSPTWGLVLKDAGNYRKADVNVAAAHTTRYKAPSGSLVFASGTILWSAGLGVAGIRPTKADPYLAQITTNILADMNAFPVTPAEYISLDSQPPGQGISGAEFKFMAAHPPQIENMNTMLRTETQLTISWETDEESTGSVWTGRESGHVIDIGPVSSDFAKSHSITLEVTPGRLVVYRVIAAGRDGQIAFSDERFFNPPQTFLAGLRDRLNLGSRVKDVRCWASANPGGALGMGGLVLIAAAVSGFASVRTLRRLASK